MIITGWFALGMGLVIWSRAIMHIRPLHVPGKAGDTGDTPAWPFATSSPVFILQKPVAAKLS